MQDVRRTKRRALTSNSENVNMMKAVVQDRYGSPDDVLQLREIDKPVVGDNEVLVRVVGIVCKSDQTYQNFRS